MNPEQIENAKRIDAALIAIGLSNIYLRAGILAVVSKETGFKLVTEISYRNTPNDRIIQVFGAARFKGYDITILKKNDENFFNVVYSRPDLGNLPNEGYKFRGRGFNGITGRANYASIGKKIGYDLINNPDLLNEVPVAALALAQYFRDSVVIGQSIKQKVGNVIKNLFSLRFSVERTADIKDIQTGARLAHQCNMGWKKTPDQDPTGGYAITQKNAPKFLEWLQTGKGIEMI